ncbi:hypothetical protein JCGZ_17979 [Jatropha curcas]|uniref:Uncharacterized protein n=1 Tax=Jatropha curcas TaxID=180498 RepID=A0A067JS90_JATCU|nr:hypothetical protein JCGZ_17979 [Jatropha curcas]
MADDSVPVPDKQLCLYEVDLSLLFLEEDLNQKLSLSLASISNDVLNESYLKSISTDPRRRLYVLIDPIESWKEGGDPTVYCAIQDLLFSPRKNWTKKLHYLRIDIALDFNAVIRWERYGFFPLLVLETRSKTYSVLMFKPLADYELEISRNDEMCSLPTLAEQSRNMFLGLLSSNLSNLDHDLSMRLLERFSRIIHAKKLPLDKIWKPRAEFVDALIGSRGQLNPEDKAGHLNFASGYFTGKLPIELSGDEQAALLYLLQNRGNLPQDNNALSSLASAHEKVGRFYKTLSPEVEPLLFPFRCNRKLGK